MISEQDDTMNPSTDIPIDPGLMKHTIGSVVSWLFLGAASISEFRDGLHTVALALSIVVSITTLISWVRSNKFVGRNRKQKNNK
jgi:hypothetical protein